MNNHFLKDMRL